MGAGGLQKSFCIFLKSLIIGEILKEETLKKQPETAERRKQGLLNYHTNVHSPENRPTSEQRKASESTGEILEGKKQTTSAKKPTIQRPKVLQLFNFLQKEQNG